MKTGHLLLIGSVWMLSACGVASSENVVTSEIYPFLEIAAGNGAVTCRANFRQGNAAGPDLTLTGGDTVSCSDGTVTVQMNESSELFSSAVEYVGTGLPYNASATYRVIVRRPKSNETFTSTATLPTEVTISFPGGAFNITKGDAIQITWVGASSNGILATVIYSLSPDGSFTAGNTSSFSAPKKAETVGSQGLVISDYTISNTVDLVQAKIRLTRDRTGSHDANWQGRGQIVASQYSEITGWFRNQGVGGVLLTPSTHPVRSRN